MELMENLKWRYGTKRYHSSKKVNREDLDKIKVFKTPTEIMDSELKFVA